MAMDYRTKPPSVGAPSLGVSPPPKKEEKPEQEDKQEKKPE